MISKCCAHCSVNEVMIDDIVAAMGSTSRRDGSRQNDRGLAQRLVAGFVESS